MMRRRLEHFFACLAAALAVAASAMPARADDAPTAMLVVDGSGSMWARLPPDNRSKIDIVREKLTNILSNPSSARVGLVSFGHRRRGDCSDVELIAPPDTVRDAVIGPLAKLNPRGPGPLTAGLKTAIDAIGSARPAQIVVVGDGADNCQQDTCALAADFAKTSPGVPIEVIGIGIPANDRPRIACLAQATGGRYYDITDSNGLNAALDEAVTLAMQSSQPPPPAESAAAPALPPPPAGASLLASAALAKGGALLTVPLDWRIVRSGEKFAVAQGRGRDISAKLAAGTYDVEARLGQITAHQEITIADGAAESVIVLLDAAHLSARVTTDKGGAPLATAVLTVAAGDAPAAIGNDGVVDLYLPPADYTLTASDGVARVLQHVTLAPGDDKPVDIDLGAGRVTLTATTGAANGTIADVLYTIYEDDPESPDGRREVARSRDAEPTFTLPAGTYYVAARSGAAEVRQRVAVGAGESVNQTLTLALATLKVSTTVAGADAPIGNGIVYRVDRTDGDHARIARTVGPDLKLALLPGSYRVTASLAAFGLSASKDVVLEPGKAQDVALDIAGAVVTFHPSGGDFYGDTFWEVSDSSGVPVWRATGMTAKTLLAPGRYTVRVESRSAEREAAFEIRAGESREIEVGPG